MSVFAEIRGTAAAPVGGFASSLLLMLVRGASGLAGGVGRIVGGMARAVKHRAVVSQLAECDDYMLKDMGLSRADVRDAASVPLFSDPSHLLVVRAVERRAAQRLAAREKGRELSPRA